jgi:hypothetical protein
VTNDWQQSSTTAAFSRQWARRFPFSPRRRVPLPASRIELTLAMSVFILLLWQPVWVFGLLLVGGLVTLVAAYVSAIKEKES